MQPRNITITLTYIGQTLAKLPNIMKTNATSDTGAENRPWLQTLCQCKKIWEQILRE